MQYSVVWNGLDGCADALGQVGREQAQLEDLLAQIQAGLDRISELAEAANSLRRCREDTAAEKRQMAQLEQAARRIGALYRSAEAKVSGIPDRYTAPVRPASAAGAQEASSAAALAAAGAVFSAVLPLGFEAAELDREKDYSAYAESLSKLGLDIRLGG